MRDLLVERGAEHERRYVDELRAEDRGEVVELRGQGVELVAEAMARGAFAIVQATLTGDGWAGAADVLVRVESPASRWGGWSYEVHDTKLARETKVGTLVQLAMYSELLAELQGVRPQQFWVIAPGQPLVREPWKLKDCAAYVRAARRRFEADAQRDAMARVDASEPEPCAHCSVCRWWKDCDERQHDDDHLSLVAGISLAQRVELRRQGVMTTAALAVTAELREAPQRGHRESYARLHRQAAVLVRGRDSKAPVTELLAIDAGFGLLRLPAPSSSDLFLDLEADPFVEPAGREYLFGRSWVEDGRDRYEALWATDDAAEKRAFEATMDAIMQRWSADPEMHVYHFGIYERGALARLVGRHGTRAQELDRLLRAGVLVDLHHVIKRTMLASVERYSLKELERFFGFVRELPLENARAAMRGVERALERRIADAIDDGVRKELEAYNRDDCVSTRALRDWLERLRSRIEDGGTPLPRPQREEDAAPENVAAHEAEVERVQALLRDGVPDDGARTVEQQARWLLAHLLEFHRREEKTSYWEKFRLQALDEDERLRERDAVAELEPFGVPERVKKSWRLRYRFPKQETTLRVGDALLDEAGERFGEVLAIDRVARELDVKTTRMPAAGAHPRWLFTWKHYAAMPKPQALLQLGEALARSETTGTWDAAVSLLLRAPPRLAAGVAWRLPDEGGQAQAKRVVLGLDRSVLAVQGPPGTGKTHTGAEMIIALVAAGKRVGVTATSHAVIRNLLDKVVALGDGRVTVGAKVSELDADAGFRETKDNDEARGWIASRELQVVGGTTWMWARADFAGAVDVLFVDEAGQMALADALAVAGAAGSVVLLGDPQQLEQPRTATHPDGTAVSALGWVIGDRATIDPAVGIFLEETWRLPPGICEFTSELFYDGRLRGLPGLERRRLIGAGELDGAGVWWVPVEHVGRGVEAPEEQEAVAALVAQLVDSAHWIDKDGRSQKLRGKDMMVIAPYNAQVAALEERLGKFGIPVGTVDKFQGREAEVVIYSLTSSSIAGAPRGMGFLLDRHRFNVATSRGRVAAIVVGTQATMAAECSATGHVPLANAVSAFVERAHEQRLA